MQRVSWGLQENLIKNSQYIAILYTTLQYPALMLMQKLWVQHIVRYSSYLVIWDPVGYLGNPEQVSYVLFNNTEDRLEWLLALAYMLYLY